MSHDANLDLPPRIPRVLKTSRDCRRELVYLYKQTKRHQIDPTLAGRLTLILNSIIACDTGVGLDDRLRLIEERQQRLDAIEANGKAHPNGASHTNGNGRGARL